MASFIREVCRWITFSVIVSSPSVLIGYLVMGQTGALIGFGMVAGIIFLTALLLEPLTSRILACSTQKIPGLDQTLILALENSQLSKKIPSVLIFPDPYPHFHCVRSLFGRGQILLSKGLISLLNERELRAVLQGCALQLRKSEIYFYSYCSLLLMVILQVIPNAWRALLLGGKNKGHLQLNLQPSAGLLCLIIYPFVRTLVSLTENAFESDAQDVVMTTRGRVSATEKILRATKVWGKSELNLGTEKPIQMSVLSLE